jgi:hypothetical protein
MAGQSGKPTEGGAGRRSALLAGREGLNVEGKQINLGLLSENQQDALLFINLFESGLYMFQTE